MATIEIDSLTKIYGDGTRAVDTLDLHIADGEFVVFVGPSGCGKTTALRMIAGLEEITSGTISVGGEVINNLPPKNRDIAMVFQNYALYPHMSVYDNMAFGLKMRGLERPKIRHRVENAAKTLGLSGVLAKLPRHLSGGQRQRVAMGRAIVREPQVFLMDEPLSNLDAKLRVQMRAEIARIQRDLSVTTIYVTHDQSEAMTLGDRVCVLRGGVLQQVDRPQVLYDLPANLFVASFIGSPAMNLVEAELSDRDGRLAATFGSNMLVVPPEVAAARPDLRRYVGHRIALGIRPEDIEDIDVRGSCADGTQLDATVDIKEDMGPEVYLHFVVQAPAVKADELREIVGDDAFAAADEQTHHGTPFVARVARGTQAREGEAVKFVVATTRMHFFDLDSGTGIYGAAAESEFSAPSSSG